MALVEEKLCPLCQGSGWKPAGTRVARCDCVAGTRAEKLLERARIPRRFENCELAEFDTRFKGAHASLAEAKLVAEGFVRDYPAGTASGLLFVGGAGVGKTHLAVGIIIEMIRRKGIACLFYDYQDLIKDIQHSYNPSVSTTELEVLKPVFSTEILALDDLGSSRPTEWVWEAVSFIINARYNNRLPTIITTNYPNLPQAEADEEPVDNLAKARRAMRNETLGDRITERMRSRLHEMCRIVEMAGKDFRQTVRSRSFQ